MAASKTSLPCHPYHFGENGDRQVRYPQIKCCMLFEESSLKDNKWTRKVYPADQLTELQQERVKKEMTEFIEARLDFKKKMAEFESLLQGIKNYKQAIPDSAFTQLKKLRRSLVTARNKCVRIGKRLAKINEKYEAKLWKEKEINDGKKWMLGGWCSE